MPTAELIANFRSTCLSQLDFDDVRFFGIGRKHNFFDVRRNSAFVSKWKGKLMKRGKRKQVKRWNLRNWNVAVFRQWGRYRWCSRCSSLYNGNSRHTFIDKNLSIQSYSINRLLLREQTNQNTCLGMTGWPTAAQPSASMISCFQICFWVVGSTMGPFTRSEVLLGYRFKTHLAFL